MRTIPSRGRRLRFAAAVLLIACTEASRAQQANFGGAATAAVKYSATPDAATQPCADVARLARDPTTITARLVPAANDVPEHCRVKGNIAAEIGFEINLPTRWNGRIWMWGNGGYAGEDFESPGQASSRAAGLAKGFVTAHTDTGHLAAKESLATFGYNRLDKIIDHGYRAVHETITLGKRLARSYYAKPASYTYWSGCSTGGRQGMVSATRYPEDFDGILAMAPTLRWSDIMMKGLSNQLALNAASSLTQAKLARVHDAVMQRCDAKDGVKDGLLADPRTCDFDPQRDLTTCGSRAASDSCFTETEIDAISRLRQGPKIKGQYILPQYYDTTHPTTARGWIVNENRSPNTLTNFGQSYMKYFAFEQQDPKYDWTTFNFETDPDRMKRIDSILDPQPELAAFKARGGRIITYWGWSDAALNPAMGLRYYDTIVQKMGLAETQAFYRLFLIPGVAHCSGGYGPDQIDAMTPLIEWVEAKKTPERLPAKKVVEGAVVYDRAYCPYPQATQYVSGNPENPASYVCK